MCGIAGLIGIDADYNAAPHVTALLRVLEHRGPDDRGWCALGPDGLARGRDVPRSIVGSVVLVHRRLSIIDLSSSGAQPMVSPCGNYAVAYNGEVYNYRELREELSREGYEFRSTSDTEVLMWALAHWGPAALRKFTGMFALAFLDVRARSLLLARDPFGIKPLYWARYRDGIAFASEVRALLTLPEVGREIAPDLLWYFLRFGGAEQSDRTLLQAVRQVPSGTYAIAHVDSRSDPDFTPYWTLSLSSESDLSFPEAAGRLRELFLRSVDLHLRSDVPVGACLSGGLDSSSIVAAIRHLRPDADIRTFSYVAPSASVSEEPWIDLAAERAGSASHKVHLSAEEAAELLGHVVECQDLPFTSTSMIAQSAVFREASANGIKVMLDGQGSDEMLAGYNRYYGALVLGQARRLHLRAAYRVLTSPKTQGLSLLNTIAWAFDYAGSGPVRALGRRLLRRDLVPRWANRRWFSERGVRLPDDRALQGTDVLRMALHRSLFRDSLPALLRYEDRNSMSYSIESRVPFLTTDIVEFVLSLPERYLIDSDGWTKSLLRAAMRGLVPDAILNRRDKIGFETPERDYLSADTWRAAARDAIAGLGGIVNVPAATDEWESMLRGERRWSPAVWRWINLWKWMDCSGAVLP
jgi:asparagine synthase (glutamine-hydrolysing)